MENRASFLDPLIVPTADNHTVDYKHSPNGNTPFSFSFPCLFDGGVQESIHNTDLPLETHLIIKQETSCLGPGLLRCESLYPSPRFSSTPANLFALKDPVL